jgi:NitT/TauT family transport system substrate-binding protein
MKRLDLALASITAIMSGIDKGTPVKILCPLHVDGMGLVVPKESKISDWNSFVRYVKNSKKPVPIGYHSPTSAPKIVLESALTRAAVKDAENPTHASANVLLVDLKATSNFIPALVSGQVEGLVAPGPFPEVAETKGVGKIVMDLRNLPPKGEWHNFPCCVMAAREEVIADNPEAVRKLVELMSSSTAWCNAHKSEVAAITSDWLGTPAEAVRKSTIVYTVKPTKNWLRGVDTYMAMLNRLKDFSGKLAGKALDDVKGFIFDFKYIPKT